METETLQEEKKLAICDVGGGSKTDNAQAIEPKEWNKMEDIKTEQVQLIVIDESDHEGAASDGGGGSGGGGSKMEGIKTEQVQLVVVDESDHEGAASDGGDGNSGGGGGGGGESSSSSLLTSTPKPKMKGVKESGRPPFLTKIYEMVEDPQTNSIISWSSTGDSFIIWNSFKLCMEVFPTYFRHDNLSSFIYQLNNYGFRKISWERSEYAHQYFQAGQKHLLKNIKRRHVQQTIASKGESSFDLSEKSGVETELINLRKEHNKLKQLIKNLEQKQKHTDKNLTAFKARIESSVSKQQNMLNLLANTFTPSFLLQLKEKRELNKEDHDDQDTSSKRQKVGVVGSTEISVDPIQVQENHIKDINEVLYESNYVQHRLDSERYAMWEIQMEYGLNCEIEEGKEDMANEQSKKIAMELEDLIGGPADWGYMKELMEEAGCSNPQGLVL